MKVKNGGHTHFPFEKVVLPIAALVLTSYAVDYVQLCAPEPSAQIEEFSSLPADGSDIYDFGN